METFTINNDDINELLLSLSEFDTLIGNSMESCKSVKDDDNYYFKGNSELPLLEKEKQKDSQCTQTKLEEDIEIIENLVKLNSLCDYDIDISLSSSDSRGDSESFHSYSTIEDRILDNTSESNIIESINQQPDYNHIHSLNKSSKRKKKEISPTVSSNSLIIPSSSSSLFSLENKSSESMLMIKSGSKSMNSLPLTIPAKNVRFLALGLTSAFNRGDINELNQLLEFYIRSDVIYRRCGANGLNVFNGKKSIFDFFQMLLTIHPDGVLTVRSITYGVESNTPVIRSKLRFVASILFPEIEDSIKNITNPIEYVQAKNALIMNRSPFVAIHSNTTMKKMCFVKVQSKLYLDDSNHVVIFDHYNNVSIKEVKR